MDYRRRAIDDDLDELLPQLPAIAIDGPKGVGKTETGTRRAQTRFSLELPRDAELVRGNPDVVTDMPSPVFIDEWQHVPAVWNAVRRAVDARAPGGSFLLAGSASPAAGTPIHSGAGRIVSLRMRPMALWERLDEPAPFSLGRALAGQAAPDIPHASSLTIQAYTNQITRSGFPGITHLAGRALSLSLDSYLDRLFDREISQNGLDVRRPTTLRAWLTAYAAATATTAEYGRLAEAASAGDVGLPAKATTQSYRDVLERLFLLEPLPGWTTSRNELTRLRQGPKHHLADPALAVRLLGLTDATLLRSGYLGAMFESLAVLCVRVAASRHDARVSHLRTRGGEQEVDIIVEGTDGSVVACEVKAASAVMDDDVRHLRWLQTKLGDRLRAAIVLHAGPHLFTRPDGVTVVPLACLSD